MSKQYEVDIKIDLKDVPEMSGLLVYRVPKEEDERGYKNRTPEEVFSYICCRAISEANPRCSYQQVKGFNEVNKAIKNVQNKYKEFPIYTERFTGKLGFWKFEVSIKF